MTELSGHRIVVTGASRGIGGVIAQRLAEDGASIVAIARNRHELAAFTDKLPGSSHVAAAFDVADEVAWNAWRSSVDGPIHGLVTAAGVIGPIGPIGSWDISAFRSTIDVNLIGTLLAIKSCVGLMPGGTGSIVTLSGGGATSPLPRYDAYASSKAAVGRLTENLARDLAPTGVRINAIAPGFVLTNMHDATIAAGPEKVGTAYFERTQRAISEGTGDSPDLAAVLSAYLLSAESIGITGKLISARWDQWSDPGFQDRLRSDADFCTIRRIDAQFFDRLPSS